MKPNIFISSTIADLQYLRDGLRDAVIDLRYTPIMSEHGEVGYINPTTAADSCYRSVKQCQMMIVIVGKRYGSCGTSGYSVTHTEYLTARENQIPTITFVEPQVLHYKDVYEASPDAGLWDSFTLMDNPRQTFKFLDDIRRSEAFNAIIPFASAADAKEKLKLQIADFVGERMRESYSPMATEIKDILAEIRTLRTHGIAAENSESDAKRYMAATRYLLNDSATEYRVFLKSLFGDMDTSVEKVSTLESFEEVVKAAGFKCEPFPEGVGFADYVPRETDSNNTTSSTEQAEKFHVSMNGSYVFFSSKVVRMTDSYFKRFQKDQARIYELVTSGGAKT